MAGPIQEVGVAEGNMGRPVLDEPPDVFQDDLLRDDKEAALVNRRDRTVKAEMETSATRLHIASEISAPVALDMGVLLERRKPSPARDRESEAP
jgi:hypothetical protein